MGSVIGYPEAHGAVATFETDVAEKIKSLIVDVEPVQDLHGYDYPWPAGGGKNKLPNTYTTTTINGVTFTVNSDGTVLVNGTATANAFFTLYAADFLRDSPSGSYILNGCPSGGGSGTYNMDVQGASGGDRGSGVGINYTASDFNTSVRIRIYNGQTVNNLLFKPMIRLSTVTDSTFSPYSNICPITGWTGANITHHGKNIAQYWQKAYIGADGSIKTGSTYAMSKPVFVQNGRPIAVSNTAGDYQGIAVFSDSSLENMIYRLANTASTYTASQDCYVVFWFNKVYSEYTESDFVDRGVQIEFNYSPTNYEPYSHDEYDIEFPSEAGVVYGGKVNAISGELIVDKTIVDLGTLDWSKSNLTYFKSDSLKSVIEVPVGQKTPADIVCSEYATLSYSQVNTGNKNGIAVIGDTSANDKGLLTINDLALVDSTAADFKASLSGTMLAYKVKSPVSYTLTPQEIQTIIGTNNIYTDTGDTSVLYPKTLTPAETVSNVSLMELRRSIIASQPHLETKSGGIVSFESTMAREPESLVVDIEPVQEGTGDPSPDNIRPITGWTGAKVARTGVNVWDGTTEDGNILADGSDGTSRSYKRTGYILVKGGENYYIVTPEGTGRIYWYDFTKAFISSSTNGIMTKTAPDNAFFARFVFKKEDNPTPETSVSINYPATDTEYHAYQGQTLPITFTSEAGIVYGGTLDVVKGEFVVDRAMVDLGEMTYGVSAGMFAISSLSGLVKPVPNNNTLANMMSTIYKTVTRNQIASTDLALAVNQITGTVNLKDSRYSDVGALKSYLSGQKLVYELATPITYQLTPQEIALLRGSNTIFADCGDTTISYFTN